MEEFNGHVFCRFNLKQTHHGLATSTEPHIKHENIANTVYFIVIILNLHHRGDVPRKKVFLGEGGVIK